MSFKPPSRKMLGKQRYGIGNGYGNEARIVERQSVTWMTVIRIL